MVTSVRKRSRSEMVLYRVYWQPHLRKYYSTVCSKATLFQIIVYALMIIPPAFIAYETKEFWHYTRTYQEQPDVDYLNISIVQLGDDGSMGTRTWSSIPELNAVVQPGEFVTPILTIREEDEDRDGTDDVLFFTAAFSSLNHSVKSVQFMLSLRMELSRFSTSVIHSVVQSSLSWPSPASRLWVGGELAIIQREPLPANGREDDYSSPVVFLGNTTGLTTEQYMAEFLQEYNKRDITTVLANPFVVWTSGDGGNFTLEVVLRLPTQTITYDPGFWQFLKFAWIQYLAILVIFWWVLSHVQSFVFQNQVILTVEHRTDKPHKL